jgi:hypothetical protein
VLPACQVQGQTLLLLLLLLLLLWPEGLLLTSSLVLHAMRRCASAGSAA